MLNVLYALIWWHYAPSDIPNYTLQHIQGYQVYIETAALKDHPAEMKTFLELLDQNLAEINQMELSQTAKNTLLGVPFFVDWHLKKSGACYHPSAQWLQDNGFIVEKAKSINILDVQSCTQYMSNEQPYMIFHELSHAYHDIYLGNDHAEILQTYQSAMDAALYESVAYINGGTQRAYAATNAHEYFAELSEAYFGKNDFFPFNRQELEQHDPVAYALLAKLWQGKDIKVTPKPSPKPSPFLPTPFYRFTNADIGDAYSLDVINDGVNNRLHLTTTTRAQGQHWHITATEQQAYRLTTQWQGASKSLDVVNDGKNDRLQLAETTIAGGQLWYIEEVEAGYYRLTNHWQGKSHALEAFKQANTIHIRMAPTQDIPAQKWRISLVP